MDIADWRKRIDELDQKLVELLNERAAAALQIGALKRGKGAPIYEPDREKEVFNNIHRVNRGPLPERDLTQIYERLIDVMRKLQRAPGDGTDPKAVRSSGTEIEAKADE